MADNLLRLRVDSQEYESKLKRAAEGLQRYADGCRQAGGTLEHLDDGVLDFVQALGKMDTVANSSKQQLREMNNALVTLTMTYRGLTDEEKQSPFGQELARQVQILTERAGQVQDAMGDVQQSIMNASSDTRSFDQLAQGASVLTAGFQGLTGAGKLLGIEMGNDVEVIAKLQSAMAVTNSLSTIQNALQKESALMQGVNALKTAAAAAAQKLLAAATGDATRAQAAYNAVASVNPYVALATVIGTVVGAISLLSSGTEEVTSNIEETKRAIDDAARSAEFYISVARQLGASGETINELRIGNAKAGMESAQLARQQAEQQLRDAVANGEMSKLGALKQNLDDAYKLQQEATANYTKIRQEIGQQQEAERQLMANWDKLDTEKSIGAAINMFTTLRSEAQQGSAAWQMYDNKIAVLQDRLSKFKPTTPAGGRSVGVNDLKKVEDIFPEGSLKHLQQRMQELQQAQGLVTTTSGWQELQKQIDAVSDRVNILKGVLPKDKEAVFKVVMDDEGVLDRLREIEGVTIDPKTFSITTNAADVLDAVRGIEGVQLDDKSMTITVDDGKALDAVKALQGVEIEPKTFAITTNVEDVLDAVRGIDGVTLDDKSMTIRVEDAKALDAVKALQGVEIEPKTFAITTNVEYVLDAVRGIEGVQLDDKSMTIRVEDAKALDAVKALQGVEIEPKTFAITTNVEDVLDAVRGIDGVQLDDKSMTIRVEDAKALDAVKALQGVKLEPKSFAITTNVDDVLSVVRGIDGVTLDDKSMTIAVDDVKALDEVKALQGVKLDDKSVVVTASTEDAMRKVQELTQDISNTTVELKVKQVVQPLETGMSGTSEASIQKYVQGLQQELSNIDFSVVGSLQQAIGLNENIIDATTLGNLLKTSIQEGIDLAAAGIDLESIYDKITSGEGIADADWDGFVAKINAQLKSRGIKVAIDTNRGDVSVEKTSKKNAAEQLSKFNQDYSKIVGGVSSIVSGIQSMGVEIPKEIHSVLGVLTGISSIMSGIASILAVIEVATTVSSLPLLAGGGIVPRAAMGRIIPGNSFSGDNVFGGGAFVNSGELVLNRAEQGVLADALSGGERGGGDYVKTILSGEQCYLMINRYAKRTGKGELVTWK